MPSDSLHLRLRHCNFEDEHASIDAGDIKLFSLETGARTGPSSRCWARQRHVFLILQRGFIAVETIRNSKLSGSVVLVWYGLVFAVLFRGYFALKICSTKRNFPKHWSRNTRQLYNRLKNTNVWIVCDTPEWSRGLEQSSHWTRSGSMLGDIQIWASFSFFANIAGL